jgi:hypothetical protein
MGHLKLRIHADIVKLIQINTQKNNQLGLTDL